MSETTKYQKLTPNTDIDLKGYDKAFDFVFKNNDVKNIAISGPYGSGKSSLIESYKKTSGKKYSFMRISLAHFRGNENDETGEEFPDDAEKDSPKKLSEEAVLEGKIINQLIHQVPSEKIEQTSFKVKNKINIRDIISIAALIFLFVFSLVLIMFSTQLEDWTNSFSDGAFKILLSSVFGRYNQLAAGMIVIAASSLFIFKLVKAQKYKNLFKKINVNGNEIEIFENQDDSYFDKYLNEILYLFENVEQDVVVFEDLDRYDSVEIFERLHEINDLINIKKADKPIRFFYLIRDDMFFNKDRTKFFDFIIPVVPVIDSSNSYAQLISFLKDGNVYDGLNDGLETLYYCSYSVIKEVNQINQDNVLTTYISSNGTYLEIDDPDISTICSVFGDLGVSFASIDYEKSNKDLFDMVYEYGFYDISYENIRLMLIIQHHVNNEDDIKHKMATLILSDEDTPLEERMKAEIYYA